MSLVAYEASSDEGSDISDTEESVSIDHKKIDKSASKSHENGINSDPLKSLKISDPSNTFEENKNNDLTALLFKKLPAPKPVEISDIQEEDDEFLHKKAKPTSITIEKRPKGPVQITIPSLSQFKDIDEKYDKIKIKSTQSTSTTKSCGLLDILPKPKQDNFVKITPSTASSTFRENVNKAKLIPDSVKNKSRPISKPQNVLADKKKQQSLLESVAANDSDESDKNDFFSLNATDDNLPEVNMNEINAMVAKKAAKMAQVSAKLNESSSNASSTEIEMIASIPASSNETKKVNVDENALHILVGSRAKRRKMEEVNIVDLSSAEVLPNKDEWLRTALASSTTYQAKGVLTDEELMPGTRKKHQITYLAHQAKANEMELQAMWAANRHTRRQTQSKYGF